MVAVEEPLDLLAVAVDLAVEEVEGEPLVAPLPVVRLELDGHAVAALHGDRVDGVQSMVARFPGYSFFPGCFTTLPSIPTRFWLLVASTRSCVLRVRVGKPRKNETVCEGAI